MLEVSEHLFSTLILFSTDFNEKCELKEIVAGIFFLIWDYHPKYQCFQQMPKKYIYVLMWQTDNYNLLAEIKRGIYSVTMYSHKVHFKNDGKQDIMISMQIYEGVLVSNS